MITTSPVARFIAARIRDCGELQKDIAKKVGFDNPNMITMIKQGRTRLPLDKVGPMALALDTDPRQLLQLCMEEYCPATWKAIAPFLEPGITADERTLLGALRARPNGSLLLALDEDSLPH